MNSLKLNVETPKDFDTIFTFIKPNETPQTKHKSLDELDKLQNILELESSIHNLKGHNSHNEIEIKKLKEQHKFLKQINLQEEITHRKIKEKYDESLEEIKRLQDQQKHNDIGLIKIKELNKSLQEQNIHNLLGIDKLMEVNESLQIKNKLYETENKKLIDDCNNNIIEIKLLQKQHNDNDKHLLRIQDLESQILLLQKQQNDCDNHLLTIKDLESQILLLSKNNKKEPTGCW